MFVKVKLTVGFIFFRTCCVTMMAILSCLFLASAVKVVQLHKTWTLTFDWTSKDRCNETSCTDMSLLLAALLDLGDRSPRICESRFVRKRLRVGQRVLDYLQSQSVILAAMCSFMSCRRRPQSDSRSDPAMPPSPPEGVYCRRRNVHYDGCVFMRVFEPMYQLSCGVAPPGVSSAAETIDENLRDYTFRKLKRLPTLKRYLVEFVAPLMPGAENPGAEKPEDYPFWLLCSREIPDQLYAVLPLLFADGRFADYVYRHIARLVQARALRAAGCDEFASEPSCHSFEDIVRLFEVVPSSVVQASTLWVALSDFVIISAIRAGALSPAHARKVRDPSARCRLLLSISQFDAAEKLVLMDLLKSCLTQEQCPLLRQVVRKRIITEKFRSEVIVIVTTLGVFPHWIWVFITV